MIDAFTGALARRRATGQVVDADECAATCVAQMTAWGARRALVPDDAWLARLGLPHAIRARQIRFIDDDQIGNLDQAGFLPLHLIATVGSDE